RDGNYRILDGVIRSTPKEHPDIEITREYKDGKLIRLEQRESGKLVEVVTPLEEGGEITIGEDGTIKGGRIEHPEEDQVIRDFIQSIPEGELTEDFILNNKTTLETSDWGKLFMMLFTAENLSQKLEIMDELDKYLNPLGYTIYLNGEDNAFSILPMEEEQSGSEEQFEQPAPAATEQRSGEKLASGHTAEQFLASNQAAAQVEEAIDSAVKAIASLSASGDKTALKLKEVVFVSIKAITAAELLRKKNSAAGKPLYNKAVIDIVKAFIAIRDNRGPPYNVNKDILTSPNLSSILGNMLSLFDKEIKLDKTYKPDELTNRINYILEKAIVVNTSDERYLKFASYVINETQGIEQWKLLWRMGIGWPVSYYRFLTSNEESKKGMIVGALDGNRINPLHCGVRSAVSLMNNGRDQQLLQSILTLEQFEFFKSKLNQENRVSFEDVAYAFSNRVIDIIENPGAERNKGINIREFLSNLSKGDISLLFIHLVLLDAFGVPTKAVNVAPGRLFDAGTNLVIVSVQGKKPSGENADHFMTLEGSYTTGIEPAVVIEDINGTGGVREQEFLRHFDDKGVNVLGIPAGPAFNIGGTVLTPLRLNGINGSADVVVPWELIPLKKIAYIERNEGRLVGQASLTTALPPHVAVVPGALALASNQAVKSLVRLLTLLSLSLIAIPTFIGVQETRHELLEKAQIIYQLPEAEFNKKVEKLIERSRKYPEIADLGLGEQKFYEIEKYIHLMEKTKTGREALALWIASGINVIPEFIDFNTAGSMGPVNKGIYSTGISSLPGGPVVKISTSLNP
ncbi:MAG: hypothetical protein AAB267_06710, partial [Candidatus Desantisbacteria bacterium]